MRFRQHGKIVNWSIIIFSVLAIVGGVIILWKNHQEVTMPPVTTQASQESAPAATKPSMQEVDNYKVAADLPRYLYVPAINVVKARVKQLGTDDKGQIRVPDNIYDTGWYKGSSKPGQIGAMFIYGHISSWQAKGVFYDLKKLKAGDEVTVERGDGKKYTYQVVKSKTYPADKVNMNEALAPVTKNQSGLNLMTCAGKVKPGTSEFTDRLVVFTTLKSS